jgi:hypothetical protein
MRSFRVGVLFIMVGIGLPLVMSTIARPNKLASWSKLVNGQQVSIIDKEIVIKEGTILVGKGRSAHEIFANSKYGGRLALPFKYILLTGIIFTLIGVVNILVNKYFKMKEL